MSLVGGLAAALYRWLQQASPEKRAAVVLAAMRARLEDRNIVMMSNHEIAKRILQIAEDPRQRDLIQLSHEIMGDPEERHPQIEDLFMYHEPTGEDVAKYNAIRNKARELAYVIHERCPASADRTAAMRQLQDCVMTANRSIACKGESYR